MRLVRQGPAKRNTQNNLDDGDSDHWGPGGVVYTSEFEENDGDLAQYLKSNAAFLVTMTTTAAFTELRSNYEATF